MALIKSIKPLAMDHNLVHGPVDATYSSFVGPDRRRYLQIDTYGSQARQIKGKKSQSLQLDEESAKEVMAILRTEFRF